VVDGPVRLTDLCARYPYFRRVTIERLVARTADQYRHAAITAYVPVLVRRQVTEQLQYIDEALVYERGTEVPPLDQHSAVAPESRQTNAVQTTQA
jgi:hypothetical protein